MSLLAYFRSKVALQTRAANAENHYAASQWQNHKLQSKVAQLEGALAAFEAVIEEQRSTIAKLEHQIETERQLHKLREETILRAVMGLGPMLLAEAARAKSL